MRIKVDIEPYQTKLDEIERNCLFELEKLLKDVPADKLVRDIDYDAIRRALIKLRYRYNGEISGVVRGYMSEVRIAILKNVAKREKLDMTIHLASKLCLGLLDQSINTKLLKAEFATGGRSRSNGSKDFSRLDEIVLKYGEEAMEAEKSHQEAIQDRKSFRFMNNWSPEFRKFTVLWKSWRNTHSLKV